MNVIAGTIRRSDVVGHLSHLSVDLPSGQAVSLEAHVDKYPPDAFRPGGNILLAWASAEATVIPAA